MDLSKRNHQNELRMNRVFILDVSNSKTETGSAEWELDFIQALEDRMDNGRALVETGLRRKYPV
jgi:hypothetical protein